MSDLYKTIWNSVYSKDITKCGRNIVLFATEALKEKSRASLVHFFYQRLLDGMGAYYIELALGDKNVYYEIHEHQGATWKFLGLTAPTQASPVKSLKALIEYGNKIANDYYEPNGNIIKRRKVTAIMDYLDQHYDFGHKVFCDRRSLFLIMKCCNKNVDSECLITHRTDGTIDQHIFLYCMNGKTDANPESVFFHELAHALHARWLKAFPDKYPSLIQELVKLCFPESAPIRSSSKEQDEFFADILSIGMMYDSPFHESDHFSNIPDAHKKVYKELFEKIISSI